MGESSVPDIIEALEKEGLYDEADKMLQIMENNKYNAFETSKYPYGSEYSYDNTAEEGVFVAAMLAQEYGFEAVGQMTPEERNQSPGQQDQSLPRHATSVVFLCQPGDHLRRKLVELPV